MVQDRLSASPGNADPEQPVTSVTQAEEVISAVSFDLRPPQLVGVELEWLVRDRRDSRISVPLDTTRTLVEDLSIAGVVSFEPGGQLELSSRPADLRTCIDQCLADMRALRSRLAGTGHVLLGEGYDSARPPRGYSTSPRYAAMARAFDRLNEAGRRMLFSTSSVQVCLDAGDTSPSWNFRRRWQLANALTPVFIATFANSPLIDGRRTGWQSNRQAQWLAIDPTRTTRVPQDDDPRAAWARYALQAEVVCVRKPAGQPWDAPEGLTLRQWIDDKWPHPPTVDDVIYHLSTLFPPVRPRGYLELRSIDAQPGDGWVVPLLVAHALTHDPAASAAVLELTAQLDRISADEAEQRTVAARDGLRNQILHRAANGCMTIAHGVLKADPGTTDLARYVQDFANRYTERGRSPADDL